MMEWGELMKKIAFSVLATGSLALFLGVTDADASSYTIKPGDSLWKIASSNKVSVADLKKWNGLSSNAIYANQVLKLAPATTATVSKSPATAQKPQTASSSEYIVKSGTHFPESQLYIKRKSATSRN